MSFALGYLTFTNDPILLPCLTLGVVLGCILMPRGSGSWIARPLSALARRKWVSIVVVFLIAWAMAAGMASKRGLPRPYVHDEFSYLLAADTFAHGRLTNPTPPAARHFETEHVLVQPTYMSKYPPGQGLIMALGQVTLGHPIYGVYLSAALAAAAIAWALYAFVPAPWALLGGILASIHPQMLEWAQRYWGGDVAVIGGALVVGGMARCAIRDCRFAMGNAMAVGSGLLILANSRPFEGLVLAVIVLGLSLPRLLKRKRLWKLAWGTLLVLVPGAIWMGYYNHRVTGHVLQMPYQEHQRQYGAAPLLLFQKDRFHTHADNPQLAQFAVDQHWSYWEKRFKDWRTFRDSSLQFFFGLVECWFGNVGCLAIALIILPWFVWRNRRLRFVALALALFGAGLMSETYMYGHYAAPAAILCAAVVIMTLRALSKLSRPLGPVLARISISVAILWSLFWWKDFRDWKQDPSAWYMRRETIEKRLEHEPGKQLVIVKYSPDHNVHEEWVFNGADFESAKVLWARDLGQNGDLLAAYPMRTVWIVEADDQSKGPRRFARGQGIH